MEKRKHSTKRKDVAALTLVKIASAAATGESRREIMRRYPGAPERLVSAIVRTRLGADEWQEILATEIRSLAAEVTQQIRHDLQQGTVSPNTKGILLGILIDKAQVIENRSAMAKTNVNLQVNNYGSMSKEEIIQRLLGKRPTLKPPLPHSTPDAALLDGENGDSESIPAGSGYSGGPPP